jgi:hypothetical protein
MGWSSWIPKAIGWLKDKVGFKEHQELRQLREENRQLRIERDALVAELTKANNRLALRKAAHVYRSVYWTEAKYHESGDHGPFCPVCYEDQVVPLKPYSYGESVQCPKCHATWDDVFPHRRPRREAEDLGDYFNS